MYSVEMYDTFSAGMLVVAVAKSRSPLSHPVGIVATYKTLAMICVIAHSEFPSVTLDLQYRVVSMEVIAKELKSRLLTYAYAMFLKKQLLRSCEASEITE